MAHSTGSTTAKTTNDLLQEIAALSDELDAQREGVGATDRCQRCWYPASHHASKSSRHCHRRDKMSGKPFIDSLLAQRNNLARVLSTGCFSLTVVLKNDGLQLVFIMASVVRQQYVA